MMSKTSGGKSILTNILIKNKKPGLVLSITTYKFLEYPNKLFEYDVKIAIGEMKKVIKISLPPT